MPYTQQTSIYAEGSNPTKEPLSFATNLNYRLVLDKITLPNVAYTVQTMALPNMAGTGATFATARRNITVSPDKLEYSPFELTFIVDEYLNNYIEIHNWLYDGVMSNENSKTKVRDITLQVLSSHNNVIREFQFIDAFPVDLGSLPFDTTSAESTNLIGTVTFNYSYFKIV